MAVSGIYCRKCNSLIPQQDVEAGRAMHVGRLIYCRKCAREIRAAAEDSAIIDLRKVEAAEEAAARAATTPGGEGTAPSEATAETAVHAAVGAGDAGGLEPPAPEEEGFLAEGELPIIVIPPAQTGVRKGLVLAVAAACVVVGGGITYFVVSGMRPAGGGTDQVRRPAIATPTPTPPPVPGPVFGQLPFSEWAGEAKVRPPAQIVLVERPGTPEEKAETRELKDIFLVAGRCRIVFQRRGYEEHSAEFELTEAGPSPSLAEILKGYEPKPIAGLRQAYESGRDRLAARDYEGAVADLRTAEDLDPDFPAPGPASAKALRQEADDWIQRLKDASEAERDGVEALAKGDGPEVEKAAAKLAGYLKKPNHERAGRLRREMAEAEKADARVVQALDEGSLEDAQKHLKDLQERTPRSPRIREHLAAIAQLQKERERVLQFLVALGNAFDQNSTAAYAGVVAPESRDLRAALEEATRAFIRAGGRFLRNQITPLDLRLAGGKAQVRIRRSFEYRVGDSDTVAGEPVELALTLVKVGEAWRLEAMADDGR